MNGELPVQAIAATATFVASLVTGVFALVNLTLSKEQKVSEFRQAWIDGLREDLSRYFSLLHFLGDAAFNRLFFTAEEIQHGHGEALKQRPVLDAEAWELLIRIKLRLNMAEKSHIELLRLLTEARDKAASIGSNASSLLELREMITTTSDSARPVLKAEWEAVKRGEPTFRYIRKWALPTVLLVAVGFISLLLLGHFH